MRYKCSKCEYVFENMWGDTFCPCCDCENAKEIPFNDDKYLKKMNQEIMECHHIHPKFMDNKYGWGQQYIITKSQHDILHGKIMVWLWGCIRDEDKQKTIDTIIRKSKEEIGV